MNYKEIEMRVNLINVEYNSWNGFVFSVLDVEPFVNAALFGINASRFFLYVDLFFVTIKVFDKSDY